VKTKIILTVLFLLVYIVFRLVYAPFADVVQAQSGVGQLSNDPVEFGVARAFARSQVPVTLASLALAVTLFAIWIKPFWAFVKKLDKINLLTALILTTVILSSCKPFKGTQVVEIAPNQTAFLLPAVGDTTAQMKFDSVDFLVQNQVAAKIVEISYREHKIGRGWWAIDFVPNQILILVDRSPESRQWTYNPEAGTSGVNQAIALESQESIGFYHGVVVNAVIEEADAAKFLYYYGGAGVEGDVAQTGIQLTVGLDQVMDTFVRTWVADKLYAEFKALPLEAGQIQAADIFARIEELARSYFKTYGITVLDLGGIEGLVFDSDEVQNTIDQKFERAAQATSQAIENQRQIDIAKAQIQIAQSQATQTVVAAQAQAEALRLQGQELEQYPDIVNYTLAQKSRGNVPGVLVTGQDPYTMPFPFWFYYPTTSVSTDIPTVPATATATATP
jgi:hypothetical protein